jgi:hypothetical protein
LNTRCKAGPDANPPVTRTGGIDCYIEHRQVRAIPYLLYMRDCRRIIVEVKFTTALSNSILRIPTAIYQYYNEIKRVGTVRNSLLTRNNQN